MGQTRCPSGHGGHQESSASPASQILFLQYGSFPGVGVGWGRSDPPFVHAS